MSYHVLRAGEAAEHCIRADWGSLRWLAGRALGNATGLTLGHVLLRPGMSNPSHRHPNCEEALYLLKGRLRHFVGEDEVILEAGDTLVVDAALPHKAVNIGEEDAEMIVAYSSADRQFERVE